MYLVILVSSSLMSFCLKLDIEFGIITIEVVVQLVLSYYVPMGEG